MNAITKVTELIAALEAQDLNPSLWEKGAMRRIYFKGVGYNTKKTTQKLYLDLETGTLHAKTDCPSQDSAWESSQSQKLVTDYQEQVTEAIEAVEPQIIQAAAEAANEDVQGWFARWEMTYDGAYGRKSGERHCLRASSGGNERPMDYEAHRNGC